ncbi:hypothetical protein D3C87_1993320 [compost metagenome]
MMSAISITVARSVWSLAVSGDRPSAVSGRLMPFSGFSFTPLALVWRTRMTTSPSATLSTTASSLPSS